jgi:exonuclease VII small subunit
MPKHTTELVFEGRTSGFQQVGQETNRLDKLLARSASDQAKNMVDLERKTSLLQKGLVAIGAKDPMATLSDTAKAYHSQVTELESELEKLSRQQLKLGRALGETEKGTEAYKDLEEEMKGVEDRGRQVTRTIRNMEQAFSAEAKAVRQVRQEMQQMRGAFTQGLLQGAIQAPFLQRGPGAMRQAAGLAVGRGARAGAARVGGMGRALAGTPFTGMGGLARGLGGIPIVGEALAGQLQTAVGFAGMALQAEQQRIQAAPFLSQAEFRRRGGLSGARRGEIRRQARAGAQEQFVAPTPEEQEQIERQARQALTTAAVGTGRALGGRFRLEGRLPSAQLTPEMQKAQEDRALRTAEEKVLGPARAEARRLFEQQREDLGEQAVKRAERRAFMRPENVLGRIGTAGAQYGGMGAVQARQFAIQMAQTGGGGLRDIEQQGLLGRAFAAQTRFGVGADVSGAFLQAGRRGGLVGGQGRGGEAMEEALARGLRMGLEGSELQEYMRQTAEGIQSWRQTGIPINERSIGQIGAGMTQFGLGGVRGGAITRGLMGAGQQIAAGGVQGGPDVMMLRHLGGYTGEGGLAGYVESLQRLEEGQFGLEEVQNLFEAYTRAGAGEGPQTGETQAAGMLTFRRAMAARGIQMGFGEIDLLQRQMRGEGLTGRQQQQLESVMGMQGAGAERAGRLEAGGLREEARGMIPAAVRRQAAIANKQLAAGYDVLEAVQTMEKATTTVTKAFTETVKPAVDAFSGFVGGAADDVAWFSKRLQEATTITEKFSLAADLIIGP